MEHPLDLDKLQKKEMQAQRDASKLTDAFVSEHISMVEALASNIVAKGKLPMGIEFEDVVSWGVEGLIKAKNNFDDSKGSAFKTYAYYRIRGEMYDRIRREWQYRNPTNYQEQKKLIQEKISEVIESAIDEMNKSDNAPSVSQMVSDLVSTSSMVCLISTGNMEELEGQLDPVLEDMDSSTSEIWDEVNQLDPEEKRLIELFYVEGMKQKEIADELKFSKSKVCRLHMKALEKLKRRLERMQEVVRE